MKKKLSFASEYCPFHRNALLFAKPQKRMTANTNIPNETSTWQEPGAWRKPCIVHVTMVAKGREPIFGKLTHNGIHAEVEERWALKETCMRVRRITVCLRIKGNFRR